MNKEHLSMIIMVFCFISMTTLCIYQQSYYENKILQTKESVKMQYANDSMFVNGVYVHNLFYCVWTNGRSNEEILRTDTHELCHNLVFNDYKHFCEDN